MDVGRRRRIERGGRKHISYIHASVTYLTCTSIKLLVFLLGGFFWVQSTKFELFTSKQISPLFAGHFHPPLGLPTSFRSSRWDFFFRACQLLGEGGGKGLAANAAVTRGEKERWYSQTLIFCFTNFWQDLWTWTDLSLQC